MERITLAWPARILSPNSRPHRMALARAKKAYRWACWGDCQAQRGTKTVDAESIKVRITFHPPSHRAHDKDNMIASFKAGADGMADALGVDDAKWGDPEYIKGEPIKDGLVVFEFKRVLDGADA
jgi:crossover junction endodeoxyribonuclease RusA